VLSRTEFCGVGFKARGIARRSVWKETTVSKEALKG
jgi:hypothetical protein